MQTLESQLFVVTFVLALLIVIIFLYKVMLRSLGGPDKKEKKPRRRGPVGPAPQDTPARRPVVRREEDAEGGGSRG